MRHEVDALASRDQHVVDEHVFPGIDGQHIATDTVLKEQRRPRGPGRRRGIRPVRARETHRREVALSVSSEIGKAKLVEHAVERLLVKPARAQGEIKATFQHRRRLAPSRGLQVRGLRTVAAMHQYSEASPECFTRCDDDSAPLFTRKGLATEWTGDQQPVVASVEPTGAEVHGVGHDGDADTPAVDDPAVVAPLSRVALHLLLVDTACAVDDGAGDARCFDAESACLRVRRVALMSPANDTSATVFRLPSDS